MVLTLRGTAAALVAVALGLGRLAAASELTVTVRDAGGQPVADAVVVAEPESGSVPRPLKPAVIEQRDRKFMPLVTVIQTGSRIDFPNNDTVRHHIYSFSPAHKFDQKLYSGTTATPQIFDKAGTVVLGCNIHDSMIAYVKVVDTPYFAKTGADGLARIELPPGARYKLSVWHYRAVNAAGAEQRISMPAGDAAAARFTLALKPPAPAATDDDYY